MEREDVVREGGKGGWEGGKRGCVMRRMCYDKVCIESV